MDCNSEPNFTLLIIVNFSRAFHKGITYGVLLLRNKYILTFAMFTATFATDSTISYALVRIIMLYGIKKRECNSLKSFFVLLYFIMFSHTLKYYCCYFILKQVIR